MRLQTKHGDGLLLGGATPAKTLCASDVPTEGGVVDSLYASLKILFKIPCIKINLASLCVAIASAAVSTHFWTASVRTCAGVDTVGVAFDVLLPVEVVLLGGGIGSGFLGGDVDVMLDCCVMCATFRGSSYVSVDPLSFTCNHTRIRWN